MDSQRWDVTDGDRLLATLSALANPHRLRIVAALAGGRRYVSQLAREVGISRPLLYLHMQKLEAAGLLTGELEQADDGKAIKYVELVDFRVTVTPALIAAVAGSIRMKAGMED